MKVTVVWPWRPGCPHRERAFHWVARRYAETFPDWDYVIAFGPPGPWRKGWAVNPSVSRLDGIVIVADADVWCDGLPQAIEAVEQGAPWAVPHYTLMRLTKESTEKLIQGHPPGGLDLEERFQPGMQGGGIVVAPAMVLKAVPMDCRFVGWGQEDTAWGIALHELAGPSWRGVHPLTHLWHPPQDRMSRKHGTEQSRALLTRYRKARRHLPTLRDLVEEGRHADAAVGQAVPDRAAV